MATQFDPSQYYLGGLSGPGTYTSPYFLNRQYRPTIQDILTRMNRPEITGMPGQPVYIDQMSNPQYISRIKPPFTYPKEQVNPLGVNLRANAPGLGFTPSAGLIDTSEMQPMPSESEDALIAAAGERFKTPNQLGFMPGGSRAPVVIEDVMAQDNPNYRAMAASDAAGAQAEPAAQGAAPRRTLGLLGDMFGGASALDEYMTPEQRAQMQNQGVMAAAMQLLAASGPSRVPVGLGQALGQAYGAGQQGYTAAQQNLLQSMTMKQKMDEYKRDIADQQAYRQLLIGGGPVGAQPAGVVTPEQAINAPGGQVVPVVEGAAMPAAAAMPVAAAAAPTGLASLTKEQRMILSRLPPKEGYKEALRLMEQKTESVPDDIKKLKALNLPITLDNLLKLNPAAAAQDPEKIRILRALNLPVTLESLRSLDPQNPEANPTEIRILNATGTPVTFENVMKLRQSGASQTSVKVDTGQKTRDVEINKDIVKEMGDMTAQARSAKETLMNVDRVLPALDKAITGPLADYRTTLTRVGQYMGIAGKDANEILSNTQNVVQGLAQQELNAASYTKGQGTLTGPEREMLKRSAAGDQNMSAAELRTALIAAQKMAQYRMSEQQQYLSEFKKLPGSEQYIPFYTVTPYQPAGRGNAAQNAIDAELAKRAQQQRGGGMR
jgi:hypothetical protein